MSAPGTPATPEPRKRPAYEPAARLLRPPRGDPDMPRPASIVAGAVLVLLRALAGVLVLAGIALEWQGILADPDVQLALEGIDTATAQMWGLVTVLVVGGITVLIDVVLAVFVLRGRNWARVVVMVVSVVSISTSFFAWWVQGQEIRVDETFVSLAFDILVLLALSSRSAAAYARRNERRAEPASAG